MVAMNYTFAPAEYLIPADLKRSTIRKRNPEKEYQIERIGTLQHYWHQRTPECKLLAVRDLKQLTVIERPIIEFIENAPITMVYCEGFGHDRHAMLAFFLDHYQDRVNEEGLFYMTEWHPGVRI